MAAAGCTGESRPPGGPEAPPSQVNGLRTAASFASIDDPAERSVAEFTEATRVFLHPRCANCHPADGHPRQGVESVLHRPPVEGGAAGRGVPAMMCRSCHQEQNYDLVGLPGAPDWHLAPASMVFLGADAAAICRRIKDPDKNGGRSLGDLVEHVERDPLVAWGWKPGADRQPAPGDAATLAGLLRGWIEGGARCPAEASP